MAANPRVKKNSVIPSSPENTELSSGATDGEYFDVWLIKGIRIFWNPITKKPQKKYLVSWVGYPRWHDTWEPRENIGEGCDDLVAHVERAAALRPNAAVGTEWLASEDWLRMEANSRLRDSPAPDIQARIDEVRKLEEEDKETITRGSRIHDQARENLIEYERYKAEQKRHKPQPPPSHMNTQSPLSSPATNKKYRRWFRRTRPSTRAQGYFHYSGDDQELAKMTSFTTPGDFVPTPKVIRRFVSTGKVLTSRTSTGGNKKRRRSAEHSSRVTEGTLSELSIEASETDGGTPPAKPGKRKPWVPVPRPEKKKDKHVEGPPKKRQRVDPRPKRPTPPPDSESSDRGVPLSKQKKVQVIEPSSDEDEPLAIQARKNKTQTPTTSTPVQVIPPNIPNQPTPAPNPNPKATPNPNLARNRSMTLPNSSGPRARAKRSATGPSSVMPAASSSTVGSSNAIQNDPPLSSYLRPSGGGPIVKGGVPWLPVNQAVNRKQYVGTSSRQQGPSLGTRARMLGEAPAVGPGRQVGRPSNTTVTIRAPEPGPASARSGVAASASQPSKSTKNNEEEDLFGDNELEEIERPTDDVVVDMGLSIDMSEPTAVEAPVPPPPKPSGPFPAVASKAVRLDVEATNFLTGVVAGLSPIQHEPPSSEQQKGPRRIGLCLGPPGSERLCEVCLANISRSSLPAAHLSKWIFIPGTNHTMHLDKLYSASHAPLILPAFQPLQWARLDPWDNEVDTQPVNALKDWLGEANQFAIWKVPNRPALYLCIFSPQCKPIFDIFPTANPNYREDQGLMLVLLQRRFSASQHYRPREPSRTSEPLTKLPREVLHQDPDIPRGLALLKLPQSTFEAWQKAWQPIRKQRTFSLFTLEAILFRKNLAGKTWYGDQIPAHEHAAWCLRHQPETKALLKILEMAQLKPWHLMERTEITFIHNNSWEFLKKLRGLNDRLGRQYTQFFAYGPHHSLSPDKWGVREVFKRGAVVTFTARSIAENGETFKKLVEKVHKSPISVAYVTPLTVALVELMVTDVQLYPNNLESLRFLLDAILDSQISLMTAPPYSWKHDDMNKWREMQFTFGADESQLQEPIEALAFSLDKEIATPPLHHRTYDSILTACTKELETFQQEQPVAWSDEIDTGFRLLGRSPPRHLTERVPKTTLQLEAGVNTSLYTDLCLMQSNHFYQTEYRHFVVVESKNSTAWAKDSIAHLTTDEALRLVDPVTQSAV